MNRKQRFTTALLTPINPAAVVILGVYTTLWGLWIANPFWTVFTQAPLYSVMAQVAPEVFWGCLAIVVGLLITYGAWKRHYKPLVRGALAGFWHWTMIAIFYFMGDPLNTGGITCIMLAAYAAFIYLNLRVNREDKLYT